MTEAQSQEIQTCIQGALTSTLTFPEIVGRLAAVGVERYHADYTRQEVTYYLADGDSQVVGMSLPPQAIGMEFATAAIQSAIRQSQAGEHTYLDFVGKTAHAGCVGYFVQIAGRRAIYFGRNGESHVEVFPGQTL